MSVKRDRGRPPLTFEKAVSMILERGHEMWTLQRTCMKRVMPLEEAKERKLKCVIFTLCFSLTDNPEIGMELSVTSPTRT